MQDVRFDDLSLYEDLGIITARIDVDAPSPKTMAVQVPYADGELDLTDYFGTVRYNNRKIEITALIIDDIPNTFSRLQAAAHGKKCSIEISIDSEYIYTGRVSVGNMRITKEGNVKITCNCEPYKVNKTSGEKVL